MFMQSCTSPRRMAKFHLSISGLSDKGLITAPNNNSLFCWALILYPILYMCAVYDIYLQVGYYCLLLFSLRILIAPQYAMNGILNMMSRPKTSCPCVA